MLQVTGGADATIVNLFDAGSAALPDNFCGEINFIMGWPDARAQLRNQIAGLNSKFLTHRCDCVSNDSQGGSFFARMNQTNCSAILIEQVNGAAVRYVNS